MIERAERGTVDADLGGGLVKLRVARPGQGRSGGYRTLVALVVNRRAVFLYGYAKNVSSNITDLAETDFRAAGRLFQAAHDADVAALVAQGRLREVERP